MAKDKREQKQKKKRSLLASLFEPAEESETDGLFDEPDFQDDPELVHLFDDDEVEYSDEQDEAALSELTWSDGERVVTELPNLDEQPKADGQKKRAAEPAGRSRQSRGARRERPQRSGVHRVQRMHTAADEDAPAAEPYAPSPSVDAPFLPDQPDVLAAAVQPGQPIITASQEQADSASLQEQANSAPTPPAMDAAAFLRRNAAPARSEAEAGVTPQPQDGQSSPAGAPGQSINAVSQEQPNGGVPDAPAAADGDSAPIRLFDEEPPSAPRSRGSRTRMFRTGSGTAARIQMNETETSRSIEEAKRRQREKEAARQHEQYVQRQKRRQRRQRAAKRMAINVAFVAFIVVAVLVALYYTFLLRDIVVSGNETYSDEYIIGLTGLQYGRHMLLCDLEAAQEGIEQDPYLQVDAVDYIFPARVRIQVTERKEVAGIIGLDYNVIIDHNGYVLSMGGGTDLSNLLQVSGVGMTGFQVGQRLGQTDDFGTATLVTMIKELETYQLIDDIASLDLTTPLAIVMYAKNGLKIHVGQPTDLDKKLVSLHKLLPQFISANISTGTLYLSARGGTVYSPPNTGAVPVTDPGTAFPGTTDDPNNLPNPDDPTTTPEPGLPAQTTPPPATPTPIQPGGGDDFQG
ncbi:MAG: FtsQ-type POTRA domain-containing protein [Candidatus Aphodomorpha sp.]